MSRAIDPLNLPTGWELGAEVGKYIVGRVGTTDSMAQFWELDSEEHIGMAMITAYAAGRDIPSVIPSTYDEAETLIPDSDPITMMLIIYAMNPGSEFHYDMEYGTFPAIILETPIGATLIAYLYEQDPDPQLQGVMRDLDQLYELSPMYKGLPSEVPTILELFNGRVSDTHTLGSLLGQALSMDTGYRDIIDRATTYISGPREEIHSLLMRCVGKHRLLLHT